MAAVSSWRGTIRHAPGLSIFGFSHDPHREIRTRPTRPVTEFVNNAGQSRSEGLRESMGSMGMLLDVGRYRLASALRMCLGHSPAGGEP